MMGAAREGFNLFNRFGRRAFWSHLKRGRFQRVMWRDTFGGVICWFHGEHSIRQNFENGEVETSCTTCCRWLRQDKHKWVTK